MIESNLQMPDAASNAHQVLSRDALERFARDLAARNEAVDDSEQRWIALRFASALLSALEHPGEQAFIEQMLVTLRTPAPKPVEIPSRPVKSGLAHWQELRAKALLSGRDSNEATIADAASACRLSRSHFSKAFKQTTGRSPQCWLQEYKIEKAKALLLDGMAIADVADACGFADQSHLTRLFTRIAGLPPARWRRNRS
ncbi:MULTISPECIES: helix-turn-helix domain-containing protein [Hydrocarboniphaga]|jgi:AraC family transcriptional regulator|uniref:Transcriptional regulator, AraC family n=1 Tax=Hydrocarboniphaga effusa AP103 TaxID=1172194 RepID=I8I4T6_9GAMM|nr:MULTISPECIES: helix-turn-helix transcriptional regulator [Hydrocarboniphaga]EIT71301.1 transcriptional regulator, AraC family [Hydrocarboniphaga effusa AP103]MDZ4077736.1 helix-turn-helix transcriptional regulator [Hydrocarboniphaga sp.]